MQREEIHEMDKWDLSDLFASNKDWEGSISDIKRDAETLLSLKGNLLKDVSTFKKALGLYESLQRKMINLISYAKMRMDENTKVGKYQGMVSRGEKVTTETQKDIAFFVPELLKGSEELIKSYLQDDELKHYRKFFDDLLRKKPHILSEEMESVLAQVNELGEAPSNAYGMLLNADMTFEDAVDSDGEKHPITNGSYIPLLMSKDRILRKDAFEKYYSVYYGHINTLSSLLQSEVNKNIFFSRMRNFSSAREAALFENRIPTTVPDRLIEAVNQNLDAFYKYMRLRKQVLDLDELHLYDVYAPIVKNVEFKIPYKEARETVLESLAPLGKKYQDTVASAFENRWIDVYETEGKRSGAYSWGTYDSRPYILLNHKENMDSMFTLTHELGHSMHSYLTQEKQPFVYGNYSIFVAEVASTTNEALLNHYLLESIDDSEKRKYILNHYLEQFRGTIFRQTMFAEFERDIHSHVENGGALTNEFLCNHYLELNKRYFGPDVVIDEEIQYEWSRIPHMYYNFYVYQYATGFSAAIALSNQILSEGKPAVDRYLEFLSSGSMDYPIEILRKAGADMESEDPVNNAMQVFREAVDELEKLMG